MTAINELLVRIDATTEQLRREMRRADQTVSQSSARIDRDLQKIDQRFASLDRAAGLATKAIAGYLGVLSVGKLTSFASRQLAAADAIGKAAEVANLTTDAVQELRYTFTSLAELTDGQVDASLRRFNRRLGLAREAAGPAKQAFDQMFGGVEQFETTGQALDAVIERLAGIEDQSRRAALASAYFGDDAGPLLAAAIGKGSDAINQMRRDAHDLGLVLDQDIISNAGQIRDDFDKASRILSTSFMRALNEAAPLLLKVAQYTGDMAAKWAFFFSDEGELYREMNSALAEIARLEEGLSSGRIVSDALIEEDKQRLDELKGRVHEITVLLGEMAAARKGAGGGALPPVVAAHPAALADLERQVDQQRELNEALAQGAEAYRRHQQAIELESASAKFRADLVKQGADKIDQHVAAFEAEYRQLQKLSAAHQQLTADQAEAARVKQSLLSREQVFAAELAKLDDLLEKHLLTWDEYAEAVAAAQIAMEGIDDDGITERLRAIEAAAQGFGRTFENAFIDAAKGGQNAFRNMTQAILEDIARIVLRTQVIAPVVKGLTAGLGSMFGGGTAPLNMGGGFGGGYADGGAFQGGRVIPFAKGGVVDGPTLFPMAGATGLMGEAGPEAIMPLKRGPDGKLGVVAQGGGGVHVTVHQTIDARGQGEQAANNIRNSSREMADLIINTVVSDIRRRGAIPSALGGK